MSGPTDYERAMKNAEDCQRLALCGLRDSCLDAGDDALAGGYAWLAENAKWPVRRGFADGTHHYYWHQQIYSGFADNNDLPGMVYTTIDFPYGQTGTLAWALEIAARAIADGRR